MSRLLFLISFLFLSNCSLDKNSEFWNEDPIKKKKISKKFQKF